MEHPTREPLESLDAQMNIRAAAAVLGISPSTLSRRRDLTSEKRGQRDRVLATAEVLRLAASYRKRSLNDVASELIERAREVSIDAAQKVEKDVEDFFESRVATASRQDFLTTAEQLLPPELFQRVKSVVTTTDREPLPDAVVGWLPGADD